MYSGGSSNFFSFGFTTYKTKSDNGSSSEKIGTFNLSPRFGYFFTKNLAAGLDINLSLMSMGTGTNKETTSLLGIGPFIRFYLPQKKVAPFAELEGTIGTLGDKTSTNNYKTSLISFFGGIGLAVPIGDKFAFDCMAGYVSSTLKPKQNNTNNERDILGTFGVKVGFQLYIGANQSGKENK
jgi:hypothetical protein